MTTFDPSSRVRIAPSVYVRPFGDELVILDFSRGEYFGLDESGAVAWRALADGKSLADVASALVERYEVDVATAVRDVAELVGELAAASLVVIVASDI